MTGSILGNRVVRTEDPELLTDGGCYVSDLPLPGKVHAYFVRSDVAHAEIRSIETAEAAAMPGVLAVYVNADLGVEPHHGFVKIHDAFAHTPLADSKVRYVGEPVALVVAESFAQAEDAAEMVVVEYDLLKPVIDPEEALAEGATLLFEEHGSNIAVLSTESPIDDIFSSADHIVRGRYVNQRVAGVPIEPNTAAALIDAEGRLVMYAATQMPHGLQGQLASALGLERSQVRVIAPHVGGGFGAKAGLFHEHTALAAATKLLDRPVTWTSPRSQDMVGLYHSRAQVQYVELACSSEGKFLGLRVRIVVDAGAYPNVGAMQPLFGKGVAQGPYAMEGVQYEYVGATTTTTPTGAYRGAGRPEVTAYLERVVDQAANELGIDAVELRRRNFLAPSDFPYDTHTKSTYDTGEYAKPLDLALATVNYEDRRRTQQERRDNGSNRLIGIGVAAYVEVTAGGGGSEFGAVHVFEDGSATVTAGTSAHGQGHQTSYAMILSEKTGIPVDKITLVQSDTDRVRSGGGTGGSRSLQMAGSAIADAADVVVIKAKQLAAHLLEANVDDVVIDPDAGTVGVAGVPARALSWAELSSAANQVENTRFIDNGDGTEGLAAQLDFTQAGGTYPFGTHISVVEVDIETGRVDLIEHVAVDDAGTLVNPLIVEGQQHGGIAQGVAQALFEDVRFDELGNVLTGSLMSYAIPSAAEFPSFTAKTTETPTTLNPLGVKGIGEAATIGSTPAVQNAVIDALRHLGVQHIDMPCSPERVWSALQRAKAGDSGITWADPKSLFTDPNEVGENGDGSVQAI